MIQPGEITRYVDGDTVDALVRVWMGFQDRPIIIPERIRVLGVDAAELRDPKGPAAKEMTESWLQRGPVELRACKRDSFGRVLGTITRDDQNLATLLIEAGLGVPFKP